MSEIIKYEINDGKEHQTGGIHLTLDIWGANKEKLVVNPSSVIKIQDELLKIIENLGSTSINHDSVIFDNGSYSLYFLLTESHFSVHTWPEHNYISIDFYTCVCDTDMNKATELLMEYFEGKYCQSQIIDRGIINNIESFNDLMK